MPLRALPFFIYLILFSGFLSPAQSVVVNDRCRQAYSQIIALRFDDANKLIAEEKKENPDNLFIVYLENHIDFLTLFIDENESLFNRIEEREDERLDKLDKLPDSEPYKNYLKANIRLQWAVAGLKFQNYFTSALDIRRSYLLIEKNRLLFPDFEPQLITQGVLHIIIGMVPDRYHWILSLISMEGTVPQGENELYNALSVVQSNAALNYLQPEILFYLGFMEMNLGLDESKKEQLMEQLTPFVNHNLMLAFLKVNMLARSARNDDALKLLNEITQWKGYHPFYYLFYLKGEYRLRKLDRNAIEDYRRFIDGFQGKNFIKDAWRKSGWCYLLQGNTEAYNKTMKKVLSTGELNVDADKEAEKEANSGKMPNIVLLKARLLFDGGYYSKARNILMSADTALLASDEKTERLYRLGRVEQKSGNHDLAKAFLIKTVESGKNSRRYFAGNAALQLGIMFEEENNFPQALKYYNLCRSLDFDEYETSIKEKAKQGIQRIEDKKYH
jgi:tetratricopeptide (TPR) repeat protein